MNNIYLYALYLIDQFSFFFILGRLGQYLICFSMKETYGFENYVVQVDVPKQMWIESFKDFCLTTKRSIKSTCLPRSSSICPQLFQSLQLNSISTPNIYNGQQIIFTFHKGVLNSWLCFCTLWTHFLKCIISLCVKILFKNHLELQFIQEISLISHPGFIISSS